MLDRKKTGLSRGFTFIEMAEAEADTAIATLQGKVLDGRAIHNAITVTKHAANTSSSQEVQSAALLPTSRHRLWELHCAMVVSPKAMPWAFLIPYRDRPAVCLVKPSAWAFSGKVMPHLIGPPYATRQHLSLEDLHGAAGR